MRKPSDAITLWAWAVPCAAILVSLSLWLAPHLRAPTSPETIKSLVLPWAVLDCVPEPVEQLRFLFAILIPPAVFLAFSKIKREPSGRWRKAAWTTQIIALVFMLAQLVLQNTEVHIYVGGWHWLRVFLLATGFVWLRPDRKLVEWASSPRSRRGWVAKLPHLLAVIFAVWELSPGLVREQYLAQTAAGLRYHLPFTLGEFAAVLNGRTPRFDFFSLYSNLMGFAAIPFFKIFGLSLLSYTALMALLNLASLLLAYRVLLACAGNAWIAIALYLPFLGLAFYPIQDWHGQRYSAFTYFAAYPIRILPTWITGFLLVRYLKAPSAWRLHLVFATGALAAWHNIEFGVPTLAAALIAITLGAERSRWIRIASSFFASTVATLSLILILGYVRSGVPAQLENIIVMLKGYGTAGYYNIALPDWGWHWLVYFTFLASLAGAIFRVSADQILNGTLGFMGVFGLLSLAYYQGRSNFEVLISYFWNWAFCCMLLILAHLRRAHPRVEPLSRIPLALLCVGYCLCLTWFIKLPPISAQIERFSASAAPYHRPTTDEAAAFVKKYASPGTKLAIVYPYGFMIAENAGVRNIYPFAEGHNVLLKKHGALVEQIMEKEQVTQIFGHNSGGIQHYFSDHGFQEKDRVGDFVYYIKTK